MGAGAREGGGNGAANGAGAAGKFKPLGRNASGARERRPNPFKKQLSQQKEEKRRQLQEAADAERKKERLAQSLKQRKRHAKKMGRRSRRGQPVMENHIDQILAKLQAGS